MFEVSSMPKSDDSRRATRRRFTDEYKLRIVQEYDALKDPHEKGALLRREGLSHPG
jgi:transposase